jgi:hypothetical protein
VAAPADGALKPASAPAATRQLVLTVWSSPGGEFAARAVLADGSVHDFASPFELARFLAARPPRPAPTPPKHVAPRRGLR